MKNALLLLVLPVFAVVIGCSKSKTDTTGCSGGTDTYKINEPFTVCYGTGAQGQDDNVTLNVHFDEVYGDSRCPLDAICVWQGRVDVGLSFTSGQESAKDTLSLGGLNGDPVSDSTVFAGYKIKLLKVDPYPTLASSPIPVEEYKVRLLITH